MALHNYIYIKHKEDELAKRIARDHDPRPVCIQPTELESSPIAVEYEEESEDESNKGKKEEPIIEYRQAKQEPIIEYKTEKEVVFDEQQQQKLSVSNKSKMIMKDGKMRKLKPRLNNSKVTKDTLPAPPKK